MYALESQLVVKICIKKPRRRGDPGLPELFKLFTAFTYF
jgi:hypothetical protein